MPPSCPGIQVTTLPNGLRVATAPIPHVESVAVGAWFGVGTRHEGDGRNGVAHLVEHMVVKGTRRRSAEAIAQEIEDVGGHLNAYTSRENTAYYAKVLKEDCGLALDIIADILQHSVHDEGELARERQVVCQEIGQAIDTPDDIIFDHFQATAYRDQSLGRPILGTVDSVSALKRTDVLGYLDRNYGTADLVVAAAGNIDHARFVDMVMAQFGDLAQAGPDQPQPARYRGGEYREARDLEQLHLVLGFEGVGYHDPDFHTAAMLSTLLGGGMSSRLFQEVREKRGLAYSVYSFTSAFAETGLFSIYAGTDGRDAPELLPVICDQLVGVTDRLGQDEVNRARAQMRAGLLMGQESPMARAEQLAQQLLIFGRPLPTSELLAKLDAVDGDRIQGFARRLLSSPPTLAVLGPIDAVEEYGALSARLAA